MSKYLCYKDTIKLVVTTDPDGYGDTAPAEFVDLACDFFQSTGHGHANQVDIVNSDAHAYIDYENPEVSSRGYRLEDMLVVANPFNAPEAESWYKISKVIVGTDKLLCNKIDNVHIYLKKTESL